MEQRTDGTLKRVAVEVHGDMAHDHEIDGSYLTRSDLAIQDIHGSGEGLTIEAILPCPECDETLEVSFQQSSAPEATEIDYPLDDGEAGLD